MDTATFSSRPDAGRLLYRLGTLLLPAWAAWPRPLLNESVAPSNQPARWRAWSQVACLAALALLLLALVPATAQTYTITTRVGNGTRGFSGDGGGATSAQLNGLYGVAVDGSGNVYIVDQFNQRIRQVSGATSVITTLAGNGTRGFSGDGGPATSAQLYYPFGVAVDGSGNIYILDQGNYRIRKVSAATGVITTVAGGGTSGLGDGGQATSARLIDPVAVAVDGSGNIYITDSGRIRKVNAATGVITPLAGTGVSGFYGDGGPATNAQLNSPFGVAVDGSGNVYIADSNNQRIRQVSGATGVITTLAGDGTRGFSGDGGPATSAQLNIPFGVAVDGSGNVSIVDQSNSRIRQVSGATGVITTVAGNGTRGFSGDGGPATNAQFNEPSGVAVDGSGNILIADFFNSRIRKLTPASATPTRAARAAAAVLLYPNPASCAFTVLVPAATGQVQVKLLNALGQPVRHQCAAAGAPFTVETAGLAPGVYTLRLTAGSVTLAKRVVLQ